MGDVAIEVQNVWKKFHRGEIQNSLRDLIPALARRFLGHSPKPTDLLEGDFWALRDITFQLKRGEALGIIGPNGAGKSTMLKILSRILRPNSGVFKVRGQLSALIEVSAGFHQDLTGRENIYLNGSILGMKKREIDSKLDKIIEFSGIETFIDTPVKRYSSGMQARLGFSVAAHLDPDILLVDEVLSVGDAQFQSRCVASMKNKLKSGVTIIFVSHNMPAVLDLCPRILVLNQGEQLFLGKGQEACTRYMELISEKRTESLDGEIKITQVSFNSPSDGTFRPGEVLDFQIGLLFRKRVAYPTFSLLLHRVSDHLPLYDVAAQECGIPSRVYEAGEEILIKFRGRAHFLRGVYSIGFNVFIPSEHRFLMNAPSVSQFFVQENSSYKGVVDIECRASEICLRK